MWIDLYDKKTLVDNLETSRFQEMPHIGFYRSVLHGVTDEECLTRILGLVSRFLFGLRIILKPNSVCNPTRLKGQCELVERRENRDHLTVQEFLKVALFQPLFACFCKGLERSVHNKRAISSRATAQSGLQGVQRRV